MKLTEPFPLPPEFARWSPYAQDIWRERACILAEGREWLGKEGYKIANEAAEKAMREEQNL